jgi:hypothetical protein
LSIHRVLSSFLFLLLLSAAGSRLAAQPAPGPRIVSARRVSSTERVMTLQGIPARTARGPLHAQPPSPPPAGLEEEDEDAQPATPVIEDRTAIPPSRTAETAGEPLNGTQAPGTFVLLRDSALAPPTGYSSSVNEPSIGSQGNGLFTTHNWYADISTDNGASYSYISPYDTFPSTPPDFTGGFCCDQRVAQDSSRNLIFWYLQYNFNGATPLSSGVRIAVAHGQAGLAANTWRYYDFTPGQFGMSDKWFDFPHLQASANDLYFTTNIFSGSGSFYGALVVRMPLAQLDAGVPLTVDSYLTTSFGSIMAVTGAAAEGSRPGRTTMYFAALYSTTSLKVMTWPEASPSPTVSDVNGLASTSLSTDVCTGPDGLNPCTRANARAQTGWITDTELGIMWTSAQNGAARPYPYTRVAILNPSTLAVISQPDIYSTTSAWLYPAVSVNERGHLGGVIDNLGGNVLPTMRVLIRDDLSPDPATSGWETFAVATSTNGTSGRWGDYNGTAPYEKYPRTWLAAGHVQNGNSSNSGSQTHNFWFGRERDTTPALTVVRAGGGTGTVTSGPAGITCGAACTASYTVGTTVTRTATPGALSTFTGWSGACSGTGSCAVTMDMAKSVTATFLAPATLTVSKAGTGTGTVTSNPAGINCGGTCSALYNGGSTVTLTAAAGTGSLFLGWGGACSGTAACLLTLDASKTATATFSPVLALDFYTVQPCRLLDTRTAEGGALLSTVPRLFNAAGLCGVPADAAAIAVNIAAVAPPALGYVTLYPGNGSAPAVSSINFNVGDTRSNNATILLSTDALGMLGARSSVANGGGVDVVIDVTGYYK